MNHFVEESDAEIIGFIHENCIGFSLSWLEELVSFAIQDDIGAVGPQLLYQNGPIYCSGLILVMEGIARRQFNGVVNEEPNAYFGWASLVKGYSALPVECVLMKRRVFEGVSGLTASLMEPAAKVMDLCLKIKDSGFRNVVIPDVQVRLNQILGTKEDLGGEELIKNPSDRDYLVEQWGRWIEQDPAFNPYLNLHKGKPIVKPPMREN